jgi:hypothetical protein
VAALVVLERDRGAVFAPDQPAEIVRVRKKHVADHVHGLVRDVDNDWRLDVEHVTRLGVLHRRVRRLQLILGRGLDVVNVPAKAWSDFVDGKLRRVR